jgi:hypothetical protein
MRSVPRSGTSPPARQLPRQGLGALAVERRITTQHGAVNTRGLLWCRLTAHRPLGRVRLDAQLPQVASKFLPPLPKCGLPNVQPSPVLADCLHYDMQVRVSLIGMQGHGVAVLQGELLRSEFPNGRALLLGWRAFRVENTRL